MTENERELIRIVRESDDPDKVLCYMIGIMTSFLKGASIDEVKAHFAIG